MVDQEEADSSEAVQPGYAEPVRDAQGRWMAGQTGNPAGRPVVVAGVRELARRYTLVAVQALVEVTTDRAAPPAARVLAARELLDRGHGRPRPAADVPGLEWLHDDQLDELSAFDAGAAAAAAVLGISAAAADDACE